MALSDTSNEPMGLLATVSDTSNEPMGLAKLKFKHYGPIRYV